LSTPATVRPPSAEFTMAWIVDKKKRGKKRGKKG
jgi:hypothetical protein